VPNQNRFGTNGKSEKEERKEKEEKRKKRRKTESDLKVDCCMRLK
jgi:hypothetical protein